MGSAMMNEPETVADMVKAVRRTSNLPISVKMRVFKDARCVLVTVCIITRKTLDFAKCCELSGANFVIVHGRTASDTPNSPVNFEQISMVCAAVTGY